MEQLRWKEWRSPQPSWCLPWDPGPHCLRWSPVHRLGARDSSAWAWAELGGGAPCLGASWPPPLFTLVQLLSPSLGTALISCGICRLHPANIRCSSFLAGLVCSIIFYILLFLLAFFFFLPHHVACGVLVPQPGIEPTFTALEGGFLTTGLPGRFPLFNDFIEV